MLASCCDKRLTKKVDEPHVEPMLYMVVNYEVSNRRNGFELKEKDRLEVLYKLNLMKEDAEELKVRSRPKSFDSYFSKDDI